MDELFADMQSKGLIEMKLSLEKFPHIGQIEIQKTDVIKGYKLTENCPKIIVDKYIDRRN